MDTEILKDNVYIIFLFSNVPVMAEKKDVYFAYIPARPGVTSGVPGRSVMYAGLDHGCIWGKGCRAALRLTSRRWRGGDERKVQ